MQDTIIEASIRNRRHATPALLSVIIPAYNERETMSEVLDAVLRERSSKEIIVVDDGSQDGTDDIIGEWVDRNPNLNSHTDRLVWLRQTENRGKGAALRNAIRFAEGVYVVTQDADLEVDPSAYGELIEPLLKGEAAFVIGYRKSQFSPNRLFHAGGVWLLGRAVWLFYGYSVRDAACCFKVLSLNNLKNMKLSSSGFEICPELIAKSARMNLSLAQISVDYVPRSLKQGKKLRLIKDGLKSFITLWRYRTWRASQTSGMP